MTTRKPAKNPTMTAKRRLFVAALIANPGRSRKSAAIEAGFSVKTAGDMAKELMKMPIIRDAIAEGLRAQENRQLITADKNLQRIDRLADRAEIEGDLQAALKASQMIGQHYGSFPNKLEHSGPGGQPLPAVAVAPIINVTLRKE